MQPSCLPLASPARNGVDAGSSVQHEGLGNGLLLSGFLTAFISAGLVRWLKSTCAGMAH